MPATLDLRRGQVTGDASRRAVNLNYLTSSGVSGLTAGQLTVAGSATTITSSIANGQLPATATNDNATAGHVGEYMSVNVPQASAVALTTGVAAVIATLTLTPGDWDLGGNVFAFAATPVLAGSFLCYAGTTGSADFSNVAGLYLPTATYNLGLTIPTIRASLTASTAYHLYANATFATGTASGIGNIWARRAR